MTITRIPPAQSMIHPDIGARAARSGGAMFAAKGIRFFFIMLVNLILINLLVPADFGMVRYVLLVVGIANLLNEMGLTTAIVQRERLERESLWSLAVICTAWGWFLYGVLFFLAAPLARFFGEPHLVALLRVGALMIPIAGISAVHRAWMRRTMQFGRLALIEMSAAVLSAVVSVTMAISGFGVWSIVAGYLVFEGCISGVLLVICRVPVASLQSWMVLRPLLLFGMAIIVARMVDYALGNAPFILIGKVIGKEGLGLFSVAHDLAIFPQMTLNAVLSQVMLSAFSRIRSDEEKTATAFGRLQLFGIAGVLPVLLVMAFMPVELVRVISFLRSGDVWLEVAPLLRWLALMGVMYVATTFSNAVWLSQGKVRESIGVSVAMCVTIIIAIAIGVHWGVEGICIALLVRSVVVFPLYVYINFRLTMIPQRVYYDAVISPLVAGMVMAAVLIAFHHFVPGTGLLRNAGVLVAGGITGSAAYVLVFFLFFRTGFQQITDMARMVLPAGFYSKKKVTV
ncbi:MAG: lipopolysaccharide biosynthesis protein [Chitinispirillaceae bacterium]|nr:lipopolysaccharide biosynthesis protein [Chitinispirillaceae bacterium]